MLRVLSHSVMSNSLWPHGYSPPGSSVHGNFPVKNTRMGCHALLQGIFPTQGSNPGLTHCRWIIYHLRHQWSPYLRTQNNLEGINMNIRNIILLPQKLFSSVQSLSRVQLFVTPWITARQASLSITNSQSLLKLTSIHPSHPLSSPSLAFNLSQIKK